MAKKKVSIPASPAVQPMFDAESTRRMVVALGRSAAASLASGVAMSLGEPQTVEAVLRIQREVYAAFSSLAYRDSSLPALTDLAQEEPATKVLSAINRFTAATVAAGVIGSSGRRHSIGDAMRTYYSVLATLWPKPGQSSESDPAEESPDATAY